MKCSWAPCYGLTLERSDLTEKTLKSPWEMTWLPQNPAVDGLFILLSYKRGLGATASNFWTSADRSIPSIHGVKTIDFLVPTRRKWGIWSIGAKHIFASSSAHRHDHIIRPYIFETASSMRIFWWYFQRYWPSVGRGIREKLHFSLINLNDFSYDRPVTVWHSRLRDPIFEIFLSSWTLGDSPPKSRSACRSDR